MKVLHVVASLSPEWGGPVTAVKGLVAALAGCSVECAVFAPVGYRVGTKPVAFNGLDVRLFPAGPLSHLWFGFSPELFSAIRRHVHEFDLVHIHELWHFPHWAAVASASKRGVPYVISPRGQLSPWALRHRQPAKVILARLFQRAALERAAALHALSEEEAEQIQRFGIGGRLCVVPNALSQGALSLSATPDRLYERFPELSEKLVVLFVGRIHPIKGLDVLVEAFAEVRRLVERAHLLVVGPDETRGTAQLRRLARTVGVEGDITFAGPLYGPDKESALAAARLFVLPSRSEGQSSALLEAMAAELPVVVTPAANRPDVGLAGAGLVAPLDPRSLASAMAELLLDRPRADGLGANGRRLVRQSYTWESVARDMARLYQSCVGGTTLRE